MKIAIFENEINMVEGSFSAMNIAFFNGTIQFEYYATSQDGQPFEKLQDYLAVFIDIQLAPKSELDGFGLIKELIKVISLDQIAILTGHSKNDEILQELGLPEIPIISKPIDYMKLYRFIKTNFNVD
jgi:DNA-binding NtrC family response regulator